MATMEECIRDCERFRSIFLSVVEHVSFCKKCSQLLRKPEIAPIPSPNADPAANP